MAYSVTPYKLVVLSKTLGDFGGLKMSDKLAYPNKTEEQIAEMYRERCEEIKQQIERHIDNVQIVFIREGEE